VEQHSLPDGVVLLDDGYAQGLAMQAEALGLRLGVDLEVATLTIAGSPILWGWDQQMHCTELDPSAVAKAVLGGMATLASGSQDLPPLSAAYLRWSKGWPEAQSADQRSPGPKT
jgi:hypothetical protein